MKILLKIFLTSWEKRSIKFIALSPLSKSSYPEYVPKHKSIVCKKIMSTRCAVSSRNESAQITTAQQNPVILEEIQKTWDFFRSGN